MVVVVSLSGSRKNVKSFLALQIKYFDDTLGIVDMRFSSKLTDDWKKSCMLTASLQAKRKVFEAPCPLGASALAAYVCFGALRLRWVWRLITPGNKYLPAIPSLKG
jgi:hypothetical protein